MMRLSKLVHKLWIWIFVAAFAGCGGGGAAGNGTVTTTIASNATSSTSTTTTTTSTTTTSLALGAIVTTVRAESTGSGSQTNVPVTFGQPFAIGEVGSAESIAGTLANGTPINLQIDVKTRHANGSLRHAVISAVVPQLDAGTPQTIQLVKTAAYAQPAPPSALSTLLGSGFDARVEIVLGGVNYSVSAASMLAGGTATNWLAGPHVNEWIVSGPLKADDGTLHPHLTAHFAVRSFTGLNKARVDFILENGWAYEPNPSNLTYDAVLKVGSTTVYSKPGLIHYHHARWRKTAWWGGEPQVHVKHDTAHLIASRAVPNYDQSVAMSNSGLTYWKTAFDASPNGPMGNGLATAYMPTTGGRPDIGLAPGWAASTILSMDKRVKDVTLAMGNLAGSWPVHYRDKVTNRPISLADYPYMTDLAPWYDSVNPGAGNRQEGWTDCVGDCTVPNVPDTAHLPAFSYIPYLLTGDHYYLEELQFYGMWAISNSVGAYREYGKGLVSISNQIRGMAWILRDAFNAAYILPDSDPMKGHFASILANNMDWYNTNYTNNPGTNVFGVLTNSYAFAYPNSVTGQASTGIAPWQDDFFTSVIGHAAERGFPDTSQLLAWKSRFAVGRMTDPGYCWVLGSIYALFLRDTSTSPTYTTYAQAYQASTSAALRATACGSAEMASVLQAESGTPMVAGAMSGYPTAATGFPANSQPAFAYAKDSGIAGGATAWNVFNARALKGDYTIEPQFAIVPR